MTGKATKPPAGPTPNEKAIARWENEGGARKKRPRDPAQLAKLMVDIATGEVEDREPTSEEQGKR